MKARMILAAALIGVLAFSATVVAQSTEEESGITQASNFLRFLKFNIGKMSEELDQARKEQNVKKANCIESRLVDLKRIYGQTQANNASLRDAALARESARIRQVFNDIRNDRDVAEQIVKLVNACYAQIDETGGFTETVEQFMGQQPITDEEDQGSDHRVDVPEPLPPEYEPEPISSSSET